MECGFLKAAKQNSEGIKFEGEIKLGGRINGNVQLIENPRAKREGASEQTPDYMIGYRPYHWRNGARIQGSAWLKHSDKADDFLSLTMDDPDWQGPVNLTAFSDGSEGFRVVWSRLRARSYTDKLNHTDWQRVSRADYCFDFHSPAFSAEFTPGLSQAVVIHSSAKAHEAGSFGMWTRGGQGETLTLGSKSGLQVQCYNKTLEIDEASGKTWLYAIWLAALQGEWVFGDSPKPRDVWRLECRFSGDFLKERNIRTPKQFASVQSELIAEALYTRRLGVPSGSDDNRWRWPMHPLWSEAVRLRAADAMLPMGRKVTGRRVALIERAEMAIAGALRSASVLEGGDFDEARVVDFVSRAQERIARDPHHEKKILAAQSRYQRTEEAR